MLKAEKLWIAATQKSSAGEFQAARKSVKLVTEDRAMKCKGRLAESDLNVDAKYRIILPREGKLTELVILDCHNKVHHSGVRATLAEVRARYWIPKR